METLSHFSISSNCVKSNGHIASVVRIKQLGHVVHLFSFSSFLACVFYYYFIILLLLFFWIEEKQNISCSLTPHPHPTPPTQKTAIWRSRVMYRNRKKKYTSWGIRNENPRVAIKKCWKEIPQLQSDFMRTRMASTSWPELLRRELVFKDFHMCPVHLQRTWEKRRENEHHQSNFELAIQFWISNYGIWRPSNLTL